MNTLKFLYTTVILWLCLTCARAFSYPRTIISPVSCDSSVTDVIIVHSKPSHFKERDALRNTWAFEAEDRRRLFVLGESEVGEQVREEHEQYGDILLLDFVDSYKNLTVKHLSGMNWILENCLGVQRILKTDDDIFVDIIQLHQFLNFFGIQNNLNKRILCHVLADKEVLRDPESKWFLSVADYPNQTFPMYCSGSAYVTSVEVMRSILEAAKELKPIFIDDVFVTGIAGEEAHIDLYDWSDNFLTSHYLDKDQILSSKSSLYSPQLMVAFDITPDQVRVLFSKAVNCFKHKDKCYGQMYMASAEVKESFRPKLMRRSVKDNPTRDEL